MGAPVGNNNATKGRPWSLAIERALEKRSRVDQVNALDALAENLLRLCDEGDLAALKELGDRLEGKAAQSVALTGSDGDELKVIHRIERVIVKAP